MDMIDQTVKTIDITASPYYAIADDDKDDIQAIQNAINDISILTEGNKTGGIIYFSKGRFLLSNLDMKSNVHITLDNSTTLQANAQGVMFAFGAKKGREVINEVKNVSIRGING
ncbi:glycosyl hydrolase family 28-related protein [Wenyingzhuangia sp. IMCC45533]